MTYEEASRGISNCLERVLQRPTTTDLADPDGVVDSVLGFVAEHYVSSLSNDGCGMQGFAGDGNDTIRTCNYRSTSFSRRHKVQQVAKRLRASDLSRDRFPPARPDFPNFERPEPLSW